MSDKVERPWKGVVITNFEIISQHLLGGNMEHHKRPQSGQTVTWLWLKVITSQTQGSGTMPTLVSSADNPVK
jgi:hypothetical protein